MKMLDPESVVRESEFATAAQAGSYGTRIQALVNRAVSGEMLAESQRADFVSRSNSLYGQASQTHRKRKAEFTKKAKQFDIDPVSFREKFKDTELTLQGRIVKAKEIVNQVRVPKKLLEAIVKLCMDLQVETHRGEITILRCAKAIAALAGRTLVNKEDVEKAAKLALMHRIGSPGLTKPEDLMKQIQSALDKALSEVESETTEESQSQEELSSDEESKKKMM